MLNTVTLKLFGAVECILDAVTNMLATMGTPQLTVQLITFIAFCRLALCDGVYASGS